MRAPTEVAVGICAVMLLITGAAICPRTPRAPLVRPVSAGVAGFRPTLASIRWLRAVQDFDDARADGRRQRVLADRLGGTIALDPRFSHAHIAGALMLRSAAPSHLDAFVRAGQAQRPDLPWRQLAAP